MTGPVMRNGKIEGPEALSFSLADNDVCYGYGCYETLKVRGGLLYLPEFHAERLIASAEILGIRHETDATSIVRGLGELVAARGEVDCNVKVMLIGHDDRPADWYAFALPAIYPPSDSAERVFAVSPSAGNGISPARKASRCFCRPSRFAARARSVATTRFS
jgi:branched-subunit amino acid aminotransferase/4-amino-4-deoxychorismate lyase